MCLQPVRSHLAKEQRDGLVLRDLGDKWFRVLLQKPCDLWKGLDEDLSHFLALEVA